MGYAWVAPACYANGSFYSTLRASSSFASAATLAPRAGPYSLIIHGHFIFINVYFICQCWILAFYSDLTFYRRKNNSCNALRCIAATCRRCLALNVDAYSSVKWRGAG